MQVAWFVCLVAVAHAASIGLVYDSNRYAVMSSGGQDSTLFQPASSSFGCRAGDIFTINQTHQQYLSNFPDLLIFRNLTEEAHVRVSTRYGFLSPTLNASTCLGSTEEPNCSLAILNNCRDVTYFRFFDTIELEVNLTVGGRVLQESVFVYNLICDSSRVRNSYEVGLLVLVIYAGIVITITSRFSLARSWNNREYEIGIFSVLFFALALATISFFLLSNMQDSKKAISYFVLACSLAYGLFSIMLCLTEALYKRSKYLNLQCQWLKIKVRVMDVIGLLAGGAVVGGWWFSGGNWILTDVIFTCMLVTTIKVFKFKSLKICVFSFVFLTSLIIVFIAVTYSFTHSTLSSLVLSTFNNPFFLVCPTITPVPNIPCSWVCIVSLGYPGLFLAYLQSFDQSRKTRVYTIVFLTCYVVMSIVWTLLNVAVTFSIPYDLVTSPATILMVSLFANRRNELTILWEGTFDRESSRHNTFQLSNVVNQQRSISDVSYYRPSLFDGLKFHSNLSELSRYSSKFRESL